MHDDQCYVLTGIKDAKEAGQAIFLLILDGSTGS